MPDDRQQEKITQNLEWNYHAFNSKPLTVMMQQNECLRLLIKTFESTDGKRRKEIMHKSADIYDF